VYHGGRFFVVLDTGGFWSGNSLYLYNPHFRFQAIDVMWWNRKRRRGEYFTILFTLRVDDEISFRIHVFLAVWNDEIVIPF
jgi:hypothetical protein